MYGCKGCGAMLKYDIALGKMKCNHCDSSYEVEEFPGYALAYLSMLASLIVQILRPVSDSLYFGVSFLCMAMTLLCFLSLIAGYNRMATRKMPQFAHLGGDDYGK